MFFKKKRKNKPVWELDRVYKDAIMTLAEMEAQHGVYDKTEEEKELVARNEMAKAQYNSAMEHKKEVQQKIKELKHTGGEFAELEKLEDDLKDTNDNIEKLLTAMTVNSAHLEVLRAKNPLEAQRRWVHDLAEKRLEWEQTRGKEKWSFDSRAATFVAILGLAMPAIAEQCGKIMRHIPFKVGLPNLWNRRN